MLNIYDAIAYMSGSDLAPEVTGTVKFLKIADGTWVEAEVFGLPPYDDGALGGPRSGPFAFHVHEFPTCGNVHGDSPFMAAGGHWNPENDSHGNHPGDFPMLFSNGGTAKMLFFTNRFYPEDVVGRSVVIHRAPDEFSNEGGVPNPRIACGSIVSAVTNP